MRALFGCGAAEPASPDTPSGPFELTFLKKTLI